MAVYTYKCPNCDGGLIFSPERNDFECEYCTSRFSKAEIDRAAGTEAQTAPPEGGGAAVYSCPSCGAEVASDETTAAAFCYYCHNPVVLSGRLGGSFTPHAVIPFAVGKEQAVTGFLAWVKKKWFVPPYFFSKKQIEKISGVYFPYWIIDCEAEGAYTANATKVRVWRVGRTEYTETKFYKLTREGRLKFREIPKNALRKENSRLVDGVHPYRCSDAKEFSAAYLAGFQAEKRNVESSELENELKKDTEGYAGALFRDTAGGYTAVTSSETRIRQTGSDWKYTLLPAWVLTYRGHDKKTYFYTLNGQTKKVNGVLPVNYMKLSLVSAAIAAAVFAVTLLAGGLL